jgi:hypothetical protein
MFFDEKSIHKNWYFTVVCKDGEVGLISVHDLGTGLPIDLGERVTPRCIFVKPEEYLELIEELEALGNANPYIRANDEICPDDVPCAEKHWEEGYKKAMEDAVKLIAQRASPPPGVE